MDELLKTMKGDSVVKRTVIKMDNIQTFYHFQLNRGRKRNKNYENILADIDRQKRKEGQTNWRDRYVGLAFLFLLNNSKGNVC